MFRRNPVLLIAAVLIVVFLAGVLVVGHANPSARVAQQTPPPIASAVEACNLPAADSKAGAALDWQVAVRLDSPQETDIFFTSGWATLICSLRRNTDGSLVDVTTALGGDPSAPVPKNSLTYETGSFLPDEGRYSTELIVGRTPDAAARVEATTSDGEGHDATLGRGWYLVWAPTVGGAVVTEIDAYSSAGTVIARLADPTGVQPGASATAAAGSE